VPSIDWRCPREWRLLLAIVGLLTVLPGSLRAQDGLVVRQLAFDGNKAVDDVTLASAISTTNSSWFARSSLISWIGLGEKRRLNERDLRRDVERIRLLYRISGFLEVKVDTLIRRTDRDAFITFRITEGAPVVLTAMLIGGLDSVARADRIRRDLPLEPGDPFHRERLRITADTLANRLTEIGYPAAPVVLERRQVDSARRQVGGPHEPGPARSARWWWRCDPRFELVTSLLVTAGRASWQSDVLRSQKNIAASELYRFASVQVDTARLTESLDSVPLVVRVLPANRYRLRWAGGYGTDDCFRMNAGVTVRNPLGIGGCSRGGSRKSAS
jgi:outer membrane protein assembly factor BamA